MKKDSIFAEWEKPADRFDFEVDVIRDLDYYQYEICEEGCVRTERFEQLLPFVGGIGGGIRQDSLFAIDLSGYAQPIDRNAVYYSLRDNEIAINSADSAVISHPTFGVRNRYDGTIIDFSDSLCLTTQSGTYYLHSRNTVRFNVIRPVFDSDGRFFADDESYFHIEGDSIRHSGSLRSYIYMTSADAPVFIDSPDGPLLFAKDHYLVDAFGEKKELVDFISNDKHQNLFRYIRQENGSYYLYDSMNEKIYLDAHDTLYFDQRNLFGRRLSEDPIKRIELW